jgi:hypothetical protein
MYDALYTALRDLPDTGPDGFEGFVLAVLQDFVPELAIAFLAKSGYQRGIDASNAGLSQAWAGMECKHYQLGKCPPARELVGGLTLAINGAQDQLDAWLLVTTGAVGALDAAELEQTANRDAVLLAIIDWQQAGLPALGMLCAATSDTTIRQLTERLPNLPVAAIRADLESIENDATFSALRDQLLLRLSLAEFGYEQARKASNDWVLQCIGSATEAKARFVQPLCPLDDEFAKFTDRPRVRSALDTWYAGRNSNHALGFVHGREGAGKSWVVLHWWNALSVKPMTLLITSNLHEIADDPLDLLADLLLRQTGKGNRQKWRRRLERWFRRPASREPMVLLIIDGINERSRENWQGRFASFGARALVENLAVIATCWTSYWENRVQPRLSESQPIELIPVPIFDDAELRDALRSAGQDFDVVSPRLRQFLRIPRVFRIGVRHIKELQSGDLTVERLMLTDWRNRLQTEYGIAHTEQEFRNIVLGIAQGIRAGASSFAIHQLRTHSGLARRSPDRNLDRDFDEIVESDLFEADPNDPGQFRVKQEHAGLVLGMLLADELRRVTLDVAADLDARVEQSIESISGFSEASHVMRGSVASACHSANYPDRAMQALLLGWLRLNNRPEDHLEDFKAYLPDAIDAYFNVADEVWVNFDEYIDGREWIASAIVSHLGREDVAPSVHTYVNKWLGYWHEDWFPFLGRADQAWLDRRRSEVRTTLSDASSEETELINQFLSNPTDDSRPFAADLGLLIASQGRRVPFVPGFVAWALSRTVMRLPVDTDNVAWCLRLNLVDSIETEQKVIEAASHLATVGGIGRRAAILLLRVLGTEASADQLAALRAAPIIRQSYQSAAPVLSPDSEIPDIAAYLERLSQIDPAAVWAHMDRTAMDHDLEDMEPIIAAFAPRDFAAFVRRVLRTADQREPFPLRQLSWNASAHSLLAGPEEVEALENARRRLLSNLAQDANREALFTEGQLMLAVLPALTPEQRLARLSERPVATHLLRNLEKTFVPLPADLCNQQLISAVAKNDIGRLRAVLWFLSSHRFELSNASRIALVECFGHSDAIVRICAFELAACTRDRSVLSALKDRSWVAPSDASANSEGFYGSKALALAAQAGDYTTMRSRVSPELWGFLAQRDGSQAAFQNFADDLDLLIRTLVSKNIADVSRDSLVTLTHERSDDTEPRQSYVIVAPDDGDSRRDIASLTPESASAAVTRLRQMLDPGAFGQSVQVARATLDALFERARQLGISMFGKQFRRYGLPEVIRLRPELIEAWLSMLEGDGSRMIIWRASEFYRSLALALASTDPERAIGIIRRLRDEDSGARTVFTPLKIDSLLYAAFEVGDCSEAIQFRSEVLDEATTDEALLEYALVAQEVGAEKELTSLIERGAASGVLCLQARALTLIGWLDEGGALDRLRPLLERRRGYLGEVARTAGERLDRNRLARDWFQQFLSRRDPDTAWAALRVALRCIDRRFYLWSDRMMSAVDDLPDRWRVCISVATDSIKNAVDRNEGKLEDLLYGTKIGSKALAPWNRL